MMDQNDKSLSSLQEAFRGSLDPEVVQLILMESNYIVDDAVEKLLALSTSVSSSDNCNPYSESKSTTQSYVAGKEDFSRCNGFEVTHSTSKVVNKINKTRILRAEEGSDSEALHELPKGLDVDTYARTSTALSEEDIPIGSADKHVDCLPCTDLTSKTTTANANYYSRCRKSLDMNDPRFADSFNIFLQQFKSNGTKSDEWSSISKPREIHQMGSPLTIRKSKDQNTCTSKEILDSQSNQTLNSNHDITNLRTTMHHLQAGTEVTDQPLSSNGLPPWPDSHQGYLNQIQPFPLHNHVSQGYPIPHNFPRDQRPRMMGNYAHLNYIPQYPLPQYRATYNSNRPLVTNAFCVPGWHPGLNTTQNGYAAGGIRNAFQPGSAIRMPNQQYKEESRNEKAFLPLGKVLVILRGLPGSGKTTLAKKLKGEGIILSTDDYFMVNGQYQYERIVLSEAHEWNQKRARESMQRGWSPIIIDNTNTQAWEMRPYVSMAQRLGYQVIIKEPDTPWRWNTKELLRRNQHNITLPGIQHMKERYEKGLTVERILVTSFEKQKKVHPKLEVGHSNTVDTQIHNSESNVIHKERSSKQNSQHNSAQEQYSVSNINRDGSHIGINMQNQLAKEGNKHLPKSSVSLANFASRQLSNQSETILPQLKPGTLRSHGSPSPVQYMDLSLPGFSPSEKALEINNKSLEKKNSVNAQENLAETSQPKEQRISKTREINSAQSPLKAQKKKDIEEDPIRVLDPADTNNKDVSLCVKKQKSKESAGNYVECKENNKDNGQNFKTEIADDENTLSNSLSHHLFKLSTSSEINDEKPQQSKNTMSLQCRKENTEDVATQKSSVMSHDKESENTEPFLHGLNALTTDESMPEEANRREKISEKDLTAENNARQSQSESNTDEVTDEEGDKNDHNIHCINDGVVSSRFSSDFSETLANDSDESFKKSEIAVGLWSSREKTGEDESLLENFKSESKQSDFQFLNTCFPDMDVQILLDVLAKKQGDVTQAVESILCNGNNSSRAERNSSKQFTSIIETSVKPSIQNSPTQGGPAHDVPDQTLPSFQGLHFPEPQAVDPLEPSLEKSSYPVLAAHDQRSFQLMLEPAVAFHLLELFGPIDDINLEGDFSTDDLIVKVDSDFAKLLYNQWRTTIQGSTDKFFCTGKKEGGKKISKQQTRKRQSRESQERRQATDLRQIMIEELALEESRLEKEHPDNSMAVVLKRQKLYSMFPEVDPLALEELFESNRYELEPTVSMVETSCSLQAKPSEFKEDDWCLVSNSDSPSEQKMEYQALQDPDYADFRAEANTHYKLRDECFRKAAFAFSKKQGPLAQFYASQGHMHTKKIRQANRRAADRILEDKNSVGDQNSLDLHGLHVDEALLALEERLHYPDSSKNHSSYLSVITGRGIHSKQGKAKIKPAVLEYLQRNKYRFEEPQPGLVHVSLNR